MMTTNRGFRNLILGSVPIVSTVMCARSSTAGQVVYTVQLRAPNTLAGRQMMQRLRSTTGTGLVLARNMFTAGSIRTIGGLLPGEVDAPSLAHQTARSLGLICWYVIPYTMETVIPAYNYPRIGLEYISSIQAPYPPPPAIQLHCQ